MPAGTAPSIEPGDANASASGETQRPFRCTEDFGTDRSVIYLMRRITASITQVADRSLRDKELTNAQWVPLMKLSLHGRLSVAEMARQLEMDVGAATRLIDRLERKGLCQRARSTTDRRVVWIDLTPAGVAAIRDVPALLGRIVDAHLDGFSEAEWHALRSYLKRILANGDTLRANPDDLPPPQERHA